MNKDSGRKAKKKVGEAKLDEIIQLASKLSPEDRLQLWEHLAQLPDSGVKKFPLPANNGAKKKTALRNSKQIKFEMYVEKKDYEVTYYLDKLEIFRVTLNAENAEALLFEKLKTDETYLTVPDERRTEIYNAVRERLEKEGKKPTDEEIRKIEPLALKVLGLELLKRSIQFSIKKASEHLPIIVAKIWDKILASMFFAGANQLRDTLELHEQKYTAKEIKDEIFRSDWELVQLLTGVSHGGSRQKTGFKWDTKKAIMLYESVNRKMTIWDYAEEHLRQKQYLVEEIEWVKKHPAFDDAPVELLDEAFSIWCSYQEGWKKIPPESSPQAFALRHVCHLLGFPYKSYNTVRTQYYKGKKAFENQE